MFVNHAHVLPEGLRLDYLPPDRPGTVDAFRRVMDEVGIERAVLFAPFSFQWPEGKPNRWLADQIHNCPELVGFGTLDPAPNAPPPAAQAREMAELGLRGIKLHPAAQRFRVDGPWAQEACAAAAEHRLVADWHTGVHRHPLADDHPILFDNLVRRVPDVRMVFEHVGGWHFYRDVVAVIHNNLTGPLPTSRLFAGVTSVLARDLYPWSYLGPAVLDELRGVLGDQLFIYGTDFPYNQASEIKADLAAIDALDWPASAKQALLGGNLDRLLGDLA